MVILDRKIHGGVSNGAQEDALLVHHLACTWGLHLVPSPADHGLPAVPNCPNIGHLQEKQHVIYCRILSKETKEHVLSCTGHQLPQQNWPRSPNTAAPDLERIQQPGEWWGWRPCRAQQSSPLVPAHGGCTHTWPKLLLTSVQSWGGDRWCSNPPTAQSRWVLTFFSFFKIPPRKQQLHSKLISFKTLIFRFASLLLLFWYSSPVHTSYQKTHHSLYNHCWYILIELFHSEMFWHFEQDRKKSTQRTN